MNLANRFRAVTLTVTLLVALPALGFKQGTAKSERNHQGITKVGIDNTTALLQNFTKLKFSVDAIEAIEDQNALTDGAGINGHFFDSEYHFDAELFTKSSSLIVEFRRDIIDHVRGGRDEAARKLLGTTLHTIQDFYAHSNWVEKRLADENYPHPAWSTTDPFGVPELNQPTVPGDTAAPACDSDSVLSSAPLATGYYDFCMSVEAACTDFGKMDRGAWTNDWRGIFDNKSWPANRCVHGGDGDTHGLNKDYSARGENYLHARRYARLATQEFVQGILDELSASPFPAYDNICLFLKQKVELCAMPGKAAVTSVSALEGSYYAGQYFTVLVEGTNLTRFLSVDISGDGGCKASIEGNSSSFKVSCFAYPAGIALINVRDSLGVSLGSVSIDVEPQNARASSLVANIGQTLQLWAENLYSTVKTAVWVIQGFVTNQVAVVTNGIANAISVVFSSAGEKDVFVEYKDQSDNTVGVSRLKIDVRASPVVTSVTANPPLVVAGSLTTYAVAGTSLPQGLRFNLPGCDGVVEVLDGSSETLRRFACTFAADTPAGNVNGTVATGDSPFGPPPLFSFTVAVSRSTVANLSPASTIRTIASSFEFTGQNLPTSGITVVPVPRNGDTRSNCQVPNNPRADGFGVACELYTLGAQVLEVKSGGVTLGAGTVTVVSNVTSVTWTSPSTQNSGTVKFGETVTFTVHGSNLTADPVMGFAVEKCGVSNNEVGIPTAPQRAFTCTFNNDAGAVAGQMLGVVKEAPGGQVLLDGWTVPVEVPASSAGKLPHTGVTDQQCYKAGSNALVSCASAEAIALSGAGKQDGMYANVNALNYSAVPNPSGGDFDKTECVKDNVTGLIWEGKPANGTRGVGSVYTNLGNGAANDTSGYVAAVNAMALCGYSNWRLPTADELQMLVSYGRWNPAVDTTWIASTASSWYWTATPYAAGPSYAWYVYFGGGVVYVNYRSNYYAVRLVRASQ